MKATQKTTPGTTLPASDSYRLFFHNHPLPMWVYDLESLAFLDVNAAAVEKYGYSRDEFLRLSIKDIRPPEDVARLLVDVKKKRPALQHSGEWRHRLKDGRIIDVEITSHNIEFNGRKAVLIWAQDITERKQAEESLRESEDRYRDLVENSQDLICTHDLEGKLLSINETAALLTGYTTKALMQMNMSDLLAPEARRLFGAYLRRMKKTGQARGIMKIQIANGETRYWEYDNTLRKEGVSKSIVRGRAQDVTERVLAEKALRESEDKFKYVFDYSADGKSLTLPSGEININRAFCGMVGYSEEEIKHRKWQEITHPEDVELTQNAMNVLLAGEKESMRFTKRFVHKDGSTVWTDVGSALRRDKEGKPLYFMTSFTDITERKQVEEKLRESEERFRKAYTISPDSININRLKDGMFVSINNGFTQIMGYTAEEAIGKTSIEMNIWVDPEDRKSLIDGLVKNKEVANLEARFRTKSGDIRIGLMSASVVELNGVAHIISITRDITERKQAEEAVRESHDRMLVVLDSLPADIYVADFKTYEILFMNQNMRNSFNGDLVGQVCWKLFRSGTGPCPHCTNDQLVDSHGNPTQGVTWEGQNPINRCWYSNYDRAVRWVDGRLVRLQIAVDITERKQAEEALQASEERFRSLYENTAIGMYRTTPGGHISMANPALLRMLGYNSIEELAQRDLSKEGYEPAYPRQEFQRRIEQEGLIIGLESAWKHKTGSVLFVRENARLMRDEAGQPLYYEGTVEDITDRKRAEDALRFLSTRQEAILSAVPDILMEVNNDKIYTWANPAGLGFFGEDVVGKEAAIYFEGEQETYDIVNPLFNGSQDMVYVESWQRRKDGEKRLLAWQCRVLKDTSGNVTGGLSSAHDITERKQVEEALRKSEERYRTLAEAAQDMITVVNRQWQIEYANAYAARQYGGPPQELIGKRLDEIFPAESVGRQQKNLQNVFDGGQAAYVEAPFLFRGETIWLGIRLAPIKEQNGQVNTILIVSRDITERKQAEETLQNYNIRLEEDVNDRTRELQDAQEQLVRQEKLAVLGQLAGGVGHELRNPLAVINNAVYFLKLTQTDADDKVKEYLGMIEKETHTAEKIITDLLDFARIKSVEREPASVLELVQRVLERYPAPQSVNVTLKIPTSLPHVHVDPRQMEQVLGNLVVNACQAMPQGGALTLSAKKKGGEVALSVRDTGVGITPENMKKLFEPLFTTKLKGIGLGLAVSRKLVEANEGRIEVQSEAGTGSTFTLFLPIGRQNQ